LETIAGLNDSKLTGLSVAPAFLRTRTVYQDSLARGLSMAEIGKDGKAIAEVGHLLAHVLRELDREVRHPEPPAPWPMIIVREAGPLSH